MKNLDLNKRIEDTKNAILKNRIGSSISSTFWNLIDSELDVIGHLDETMANQVGCCACHEFQVETDDISWDELQEKVEKYENVLKSLENIDVDELSATKAEMVGKKINEVQAVLDAMGDFTEDELDRMFVLEDEMIYEELADRGERVAWFYGTMVWLPAGSGALSEMKVIYDIAKAHVEELYGK